jgi:uncharacterized protein (TIGR02996 family)
MSVGLAADTRLLSLLQAARRAPQEDGHRLVLADWLEDHGQAEHAEFIRLQCRLAPGSLPADAEERTQLQARCQELLRQHGGAWLGSLWRWWPAPLSWHRGLFAIAAAKRSNLDSLLGMAAWLDTLHVQVGGKVRLRRALAVAARLEINHLSLDLRVALAEETLLAELATLPELPCLRSLSLYWPLQLLHREQDAQGTRMVPALSEDFLHRLLRDCAACRHLSHLGSDFAFSARQADLIGALGVEPSLADGRWWMHQLPPRDFRRRRPA